MPAALIHTLARSGWVAAGQPACLIGDSGTGKSHLLIGLGTAAAESRRPVCDPALICRVRQGQQRPSRKMAKLGRQSGGWLSKDGGVVARLGRAGAAKEQGVPAYVIFHDATLRQIAAQSPASLADVATTSGVGEAKLARYGQQILDLLTAVDD